MAVAVDVILPPQQPITPSPALHLARVALGLYVCFCATVAGLASVGPMWDRAWQRAGLTVPVVAVGLIAAAWPTAGRYRAAGAAVTAFCAYHSVRVLVAPPDGMPRDARVLMSTTYVVMGSTALVLSVLVSLLAVGSATKVRIDRHG